jgi:protein-S-isoprenylcysteine O-methyltransferase Ste14
MKIALQALTSAVTGLVALGLLLFVPAGTVNYWQAWVFIAVSTVATLLPAIYLAVNDPAALRRRMHAGPTAETRPLQKVVIFAAFGLLAGVMVFSALDHRFGWSPVPTAATIAGDVLVAAGLAIAQLVVIQNSYAAATITVESGQTLTSTGLYGLVRHPMYVGTLLMMAGIPLALDSYLGLIVLVPGIAILALRILDEEKLLSQELAGYREYMQRVHYRLVPYVW